MFARTQSASLTAIVTRIFSADKIIESRPLNIAGAQVLRVVAARFAYRARSARVEAPVRDPVDTLRREGVLVWPDFLPAGEFDALRGEVEVLFNEGHDALERGWDGPNSSEAVRLCNPAAPPLPVTRRVLADPRLLAILEAAERRPLGSLVTHGEIERLTQGPPADHDDPQTTLHSDIFFDTHKAWLYLTDVGVDDARFAIVPRSQRLTLDRLRWIYASSCRHRPGDDHSRRITPEEIRATGIEETVITCRRNTLVVANTCAYHRRTRGAPGRVREAVHVSVRANPFTAWLPAALRRAVHGR